MAEHEVLTDALRQQFYISVQPAWVKECIGFLRARSTGALAWTQQQLLEAVAGQALLSDFNEMGAGSLPDGVQVRDLL